MDSMTGLSLFVAGVGAAAAAVMWVAYRIRHWRDGSRRGDRMELPLEAPKAKAA